MPAYDKIGGGYNQTRKADPYIVSRLLHFLSLGNSQPCLDIGCGTGNYTQALELAEAKMIGVDPSERMLKKAREFSPEMEWHVGASEAIPLPDNSVEGAIATLTTHHWEDLTTGFREVSRVLRPGGRFVLFTSTPHLMRQYWLMDYFPEMIAYSMTVMPSLEQTMVALSAAEISVVATEPYSIHPTLIDQFLYSGKQRPTLYLDPEFRNGISSFRLFANSEELRLGLNRLTEEIGSGKWKEIYERYQHDEGDYLFIIGEKRG